MVQKRLILILLLLFSTIVNAVITIEGIWCDKLVTIGTEVVVCVQPLETTKTYLLKFNNIGDFVIFSYHVLLWREPDLPGQMYWIKALNDGTVTKEQMLNSFINSAEYVNLRK